MSTFRIGQRVRIVYPESVFVGREATVIGILENVRFVQDRSKCAKAYHVSVDGYGSMDIDRKGVPLAYESHELEPIIYDGHKVVSWSECLWKPEGVSA